MDTPNIRTDTSVADAHLGVAHDSLYCLEGNAHRLASALPTGQSRNAGMAVAGV